MEDQRNVVFVKMGYRLWKLNGNFWDLCDIAAYVDDILIRVFWEGVLCFPAIKKK